MTVNVKAPRKGPGRPPKVRAPQSAEQEALALAVAAAERRRDVAAAAYADDRTVAAELALLQSDLEVASQWSAYLRATGNHTHSLKWADMAAKFAARAGALRELAAVDLLREIAERDAREMDLIGRVRGRS